MRTVQVIDVLDDNYPHDFDDFVFIAGDISNGCFIPYDTNKAVEYADTSKEYKAHQRIRDWIKTASGEENIGEVLIYVSW